MRRLAEVYLVRMSSNGEKQCADAVLMIRPARFGYDEQTAATNAFQQRIELVAAPEIARRAAAEIDGLARRLDDAGVRVVLAEDTPRPAKPDAAFPNNWLSTHADGTVVLYPMQASNRRAEVRRELVAELSEREGFAVERVIDLTPLAERGEFLEGTGSLVLDRPARVAYAGLSPRTTGEALKVFSERTGYQVVCFRAEDGLGRAIYHTNVLLSLGERFAIACFDALPDPDERKGLRTRLEESGRDVVAIDRAQMAEFCANALELRDRAGEPLLAISERAQIAFTRPQRAVLERHARFVTAPLETLETCGGGSLRCTLAEIFLPRAPSAAS